MTYEEIIELAHSKAAEIMTAIGPKNRPSGPEEANSLYSALIDAIQNTILDYVSPEDETEKENT